MTLMFRGSGDGHLHIFIVARFLCTLLNILTQPLHHEKDVTQILLGDLRMVSKGLEKGLGELEIRGRIEIMQMTVPLKSAQIL